MGGEGRIQGCALLDVKPNAGDSEETVHEDGGFSVKMRRFDDTLSISLSGRLDTIAAQ